LLGAAEGDVRMSSLLLACVLSCKQVEDLNVRKTQELDTVTRSCAVKVCGMSEHNLHNVHENVAVLVALNCFCLLTVNKLLCQMVTSGPLQTADVSRSSAPL